MVSDDEVAKSSTADEKKDGPDQSSDSASVLQEHKIQQTCVDSYLPLYRLVHVIVQCNGTSCTCTVPEL